MDVVTIGLICFLGMFVLMMLGVPLPFTLGFCAIVGMIVSWGGPALTKVGWTPLPVLYSLLWTPLPLFVLVGCLIAETGIGSDVFKAASNWLSRLPGGLAVSAIMGEAVMAAAVGTSTACIVAVGKTAVPEMEKLGYNRGFSMGALCCGGVLGPLIPPSAMMIVYSVFSGVSLGKLFIAGIIPGILLAIMLSLYTSIACLKNPRLAPRPAAVSWRERLYSSRKIWPIAILMFSVIGGIYIGVVTPTEAAGLASAITMIMGVLFYGLRLTGLRRAMTEAAMINAMIMFIIIAATVFSYVMGSAGLGKKLVDLVVPLGVSPWVVVIAINIIILVLGCIMDGVTITVLTLPVFIPLLVSLDFDLLWFGIVFVVNMQIGIITPPFGIDLFAMRTIFHTPIGELLRGVWPYLIVLLVFLSIAIAFPQLSLWLPSLMVR